MFKAIGSITNSISETITGVTKAISPLVKSLELGSKAVELHAQELYDDTQFECQKNQATRAKLMTEFQAELDDLTDK